MVLGRAVSFIMLPVYTRFLSPSDYGLIQLLNLAVDITAIFFIAGATSGLQRFFYKTTDPDQRKRIISTAFILTMGLSLAGGVVLAVLSPAIWRHGLQGAGTPGLVVLAAANFSLGFLHSLPQSVAQTEQRARTFVLISLVKLLLQLAFNILFIVHFRLGPAGLLWSTFLTYLLLGIPLAVSLFRRTGVHFDLGVMRDLRRFGLPYQFTWAGSFLLTFGDRFFLQAGPGIATVGIYGLAYTFGFLLQQIGATPFLTAWNPHRHQLASLPREDRDKRYNRGFLYFNLLLITAATGMTVFIKPVIAVMTTPPFFPAAPLVPVIVLAYVAEAWMEAFRFSIDVSEKTRYSTYATWITVVIVMALYAVLIPRYGAMGAAVTTVFGMVIRLGLVYRWAQQLWPVSWDFKRPLQLLALGATAGALAWLVAPEGLGQQVMLGMAVMAGYSALVYGVVLGPADRAIVATFLTSPGMAWAAVTKQS